MPSIPRLDSLCLVTFFPRQRDNAELRQDISGQWIMCAAPVYEVACSSRDGPLVQSQHITSPQLCGPAYCIPRYSVCIDQICGASEDGRHNRPHRSSGHIGRGWRCCQIAPSRKCWAPIVRRLIGYQDPQRAAVKSGRHGRRTIHRTVSIVRANKVISILHCLDCTAPAEGAFLQRRAGKVLF